MYSVLCVLPVVHILNIFKNLARTQAKLTETLQKLLNIKNIKENCL